ncbi:MAG TPA: hypothetical protein V6C63_15495, partial [Allocoleopsis sp.]
QLMMEDCRDLASGHDAIARHESWPQMLNPLRNNKVAVSQAIHYAGSSIQSEHDVFASHTNAECLTPTNIRTNRFT